MEFPNTLIEAKDAKDLAEFHNSSDSDYTDLYVYDETIEEVDLWQKSVTVRAFIRRTVQFEGPENIILPRIDTDKKLFIFRRVRDEDDLVIDGNEYEILCDNSEVRAQWYIQ